MLSSDDSCRSRLPPAGNGNGGCDGRHSHGRSKQRLSACQFLGSHILLVVLNHVPLVGGGGTALACRGVRSSMAACWRWHGGRCCRKQRKGVEASGMQCAAIQLQCRTTFLACISWLAVAGPPPPQAPPERQLLVVVHGCLRSVGCACRLGKPGRLAWCLLSLRGVLSASQTGVREPHVLLEARPLPSGAFEACDEQVSSRCLVHFSCLPARPAAAMRHLGCALRVGSNPWQLQFWQRPGACTPRECSAGMEVVTDRMRLCGMSAWAQRRQVFEWPPAALSALPPSRSIAASHIRFELCALFLSWALKTAKAAHLRLVLVPDQGVLPGVAQPRQTAREAQTGTRATPPQHRPPAAASAAARMTESTVRAAQLVASFEILERGWNDEAWAAQQPAAASDHQGSKRQGEAADGGGGKRLAAMGPAAGTTAAVAAAATKSEQSPEPSRWRSTRQAVQQQAPAQPAVGHAAQQQPAGHPVAAQPQGRPATAAVNAAAGEPLVVEAAARSAPQPKAPCHAAVRQPAAPAAAPTGRPTADPCPDGNMPVVILPPAKQGSRVATMMPRKAAGGPDAATSSTPNAAAGLAALPSAAAPPAAAALPLPVVQQQTQAQQQGQQQRQAARQQARQAQQVEQQQGQQQAQQVEGQQGQQQAQQVEGQQGQQQAQQVEGQQGQQQAQPVRQPASMQQQPGAQSVVGSAAMWHRPAPSVTAAAQPLSPTAVLLQLAAALEDPAAQPAGLGFQELHLLTALVDSSRVHMTGRVSGSAGLAVCVHEHPAGHAVGAMSRELCAPAVCSPCLPPHSPVCTSLL